MAETLEPSKIVIPQRTESISAAGVTEVRTLGATANTALADKASLAQLASKADKTAVDDLAGKVLTRGTIPLNSNLDLWVDATYNGLWYAAAVSVPTLTGLPPEAAGRPLQLLVLGSQPRITTQVYIPYGMYGTTWLSRSIDNVGTNTWTEWAPFGGSDSVSPMVPNAIRKAEMLHALGGPVATGGLGAVAFRFDHGFTNFRDIVLPAVQARGIKVAQAYNPRNWHYAENTGVTAADLNGWVAAGDVEIMNHSANHLGADTREALTDQIVNGLAEIEAELPAAAGKVWGFAPPGVSTGDYGGFKDGRTPAGWSTFAGRLILEHHAVGTGYLAGTSRRVLDGQIRDGLGHVTIDGRAVADIKADVDEVIASRKGLQLMMHPSQLNASGKLSTSQFLEVLDYVVAKRDAGELMILSPYQLLAADATAFDAGAALTAFEVGLTT